jgi:hypothetical protein
MEKQDFRNDSSSQEYLADWLGNNIALICPRETCNKTYIVSGFFPSKGQPRGERKCPNCGKSTGFYKGSKKANNLKVWVEWDSN